MRSSKRNSVHSVYINDLDAEHQDIFSAVQELERAAAEDGPEAQAAIQRLAGGIAAHFANEESMMRAAAYPGYEWHRRQHGAALKKFTDFTVRVDAGDSGAICEMADFLRGWMRDHTGVHDLMMAAYLRNFERAQARLAS